MKVFWSISWVLILLSILLSIGIIRSCRTFQTEKQSYTESLNYRNRFLDPDEWISNERTQIKLDAAAAKADELNLLHRQLIRQSLYLAALFVLYLGFLGAFARKDKQKLVLGFILLALCCLPVGLMAPMMEIEAYERDLQLGEIPISAKVLGFNVNVEIEQEFQGDLYFYYQSKSVMELIYLLFEQRNLVVGICITLFSVLFPLAKILATLGIVLRPERMAQKKLHYFVKKLGKWSMADVFVVAVFLAYLAFSNMQMGISTSSRVMVGLYFFLGYCLFSLLSSGGIGQLEKEESVVATTPVE